MRILIADQQPRVRFALKVLLQNQQGYPVVGFASDARELLARVQALKPDVVLLDWSLPGMPMADLIKAIRRIHAPARTFIMSANPEVQQNALSIGADQYINKGEAPSFLLDALIRFHQPAALH